VSGAQINNLKLGDDIVLVAESGDDLQLLIMKTDTESQCFGLTISTTNAEYQCIPPMKKPLDMQIKEEKLKQMTNFVYLGEKVSNRRNITRRHRATHRSCSRSRHGG